MRMYTSYESKKELIKNKYSLYRRRIHGCNLEKKQTKKTRQIGHTYNRENEKIPIGHYIY